MAEKSQDARQCYELRSKRRRPRPFRVSQPCFACRRHRRCLRVKGLRHVPGQVSNKAILLVLASRRRRVARLTRAIGFPNVPRKGSVGAVRLFSARSAQYEPGDESDDCTSRADEEHRRHAGFKRPVKRVVRKKLDRAVAGARKDEITDRHSNQGGKESSHLRTSLGRARPGQRGIAP
jgi:hypothetical protein